MRYSRVKRRYGERLWCKLYTWKSLDTARHLQLMLRTRLYSQRVNRYALTWTAILGLEIDDADQPIDWLGTVENRLKMPGWFSQSPSDVDTIEPNRELLLSVAALA